MQGRSIIFKQLCPKTDQFILTSSQKDTDLLSERSGVSLGSDHFITSTGINLASL